MFSLSSISCSSTVHRLPEFSGNATAFDATTVVPSDSNTCVDSIAAIGICRRRGLGKVRHLATADLCIQDRLKKKDFALHKVLGTENPADIMTKHVGRVLLSKHMQALGLEEESGRASSAPSI